VVDARGGAPRRLTDFTGDERWPSWLPDRRLAFAARERGQWDLPLLDPSRPVPHLERLTDTTTDETEPRVSPDGRLLAFVSTRDAHRRRSRLVAAGADRPRRRSYAAVAVP
jgi:Tol biopolymer transport system component